MYLFFDSVRVTTAGVGWMSGYFRGGMGETTSMAIIFVPFFIGVFALFYDASMKWGYWLTGLGVAFIAVEIVSRIHFFFNTKLTHFLGMLVLFAAGAALMLKSSHKMGNDDEK